ncbi:hypothetical protein DI005_16665 [Prauserella sp. PE36]|uniref:hypothetical protein n=1 Tax=Prauserella sp. PE36 TaxID=1504709 RepID=UPI000DE4CA9D|nr:hypothetical protein [Prauserella sp. PE36]RBM19312.1 hypothetical protein DI005_16665 [Prauserella sp. PE36]
MRSQSDLRAYLRSLDALVLADLLCEQAERDPELARRLLARAQATENGELAQVSDLLDGAAPAAESVQVASVLDTLQRLLDGGTQADVAPLARRAVDKIITALGDVDEPSGAAADQLDRAVSLYARACEAHPPPPEELAEWILRLAFGRPGWPDIALTPFAKPLGDKGLAHVKSTVDEVLAEPVADDSAGRRRTAQRLNQEHAEVTGDVDTVVRMLSEQLPRLDVSLKIVRVLRAAGRHTEAIAHAAKALGNENGSRIRGPLVAALERAQRVPAPEPGPESEPDAVDVAALLAEDRDDEAWKVAAGRAPAEVAPAYRDHVEQLIAQKDAQAYARAAVQLRRLRTLHKRAGTSEEFGSYLAGLVETHRRKTRLIEEIRKARIALPKAVRQ